VKDDLTGSLFPNPQALALAGQSAPLPEEPGAAATPPPAEERKSDEQELAEAALDDLKLLAEAARFATPERVQQVLEAILFSAEKPLDVQAMMEATQFTKEQVEQGVAALAKAYAERHGGVIVADLGGRWQLRTEPQVGAYVRRMLQVKPMRLTRAALETLAIIAYRQPLTRPEMEELRGVDCGAVTKALLERKLVRILGKKDEPGRPLLYGTTKEFLELFNLRDLTQLPTLREFQELSEESRKIVEEEHPEAPPVAGLTELAHDPGLEQKMHAALAESDAALEQLEKAMDKADEQHKAVAAVLAPPAPPGPPEGAGSGSADTKAGHKPGDKAGEAPETGPREDGGGAPKAGA
jgi:segregation and condensation protein B